MIRSFNSRPEGKNDRGGRWYPSETEECSCCKNIRKPSRAYPSSLWKHCTSKAHYLNLCAKLGEDPVGLPVKVKRKVEEMIGYKAVFVNSEGEFLSIHQVSIDEYYPWYPGEWVKEKVDNVSMYYGKIPQSGLWYFGKISDAIVFATKALSCSDNFAIFECRCRFFQSYPSTNYRSKYICSMLKMEKEIYRARIGETFKYSVEELEELIKEANNNG